MMDHDTLREQTGAYALDLLTLSERREFESHLETCAECNEELRALALVTESLGRMVEPLDPPARLRARVMNAIAAAAPTTPARGVRTAAARPWLLFAASLGLLGLCLYAAILHERVRESGAIVRRTEQILAAADVRRVDLAGQEAAPGASGRAFWSRSNGVMFTASGLPPLPKGKVYQLWVVSGATPISAGLLTPDAAGHVLALADMPPDVVPVAVAVTIEPEGGVRSPTGAKYLEGTV